MTGREDEARQVRVDNRAAANDLQWAVQQVGELRQQIQNKDQQIQNLQNQLTMATNTQARFTDDLQTLQRLHLETTGPATQDGLNFSGSDVYKFPVATFLEQFDVTATSNQWEARTRAAKLPKYLTGPALQFYVSLDAATKNDFDRLKEAMETEYATPQGESLAYATFHARTQRSLETVHQFAADLRCLARKAFENDAERARNMKMQFLGGLDPTISFYMSRRDFANFEEAKEEACKAEAVLMQRGLIRSSSNTMQKNSSPGASSNSSSINLSALPVAATFTPPMLSLAAVGDSSSAPRTQDYSYRNRSPSPWCNNSSDVSGRPRSPDNWRRQQPVEGFSASKQNSSSTPDPKDEMIRYLLQQVAVGSDRGSYQRPPRSRGYRNFSRGSQWWNPSYRHQQDSQGNQYCNNCNQHHYASACRGRGFARRGRNNYRGNNYNNNNGNRSGSRERERERSRSASPNPSNRNQSRRNVRFSDQEERPPAVDSMQAERLEQIDNILNSFAHSSGITVACKGKESHRDYSAKRHRKYIRCPQCFHYPLGKDGMEFYCDKCDLHFCAICNHKFTCSFCEGEREREQVQQARLGGQDPGTSRAASSSTGTCSIQPSLQQLAEGQQSLPSSELQSGGSIGHEQDTQEDPLPKEFSPMAAELEKKSPGPSEKSGESEGGKLVQSSPGTGPEMATDDQPTSEDSSERETSDTSESSHQSRRRQRARAHRVPLPNTAEAAGHSPSCEGKEDANKEQIEPGKIEAHMETEETDARKNKIHQVNQQSSNEDDKVTSKCAKAVQQTADTQQMETGMKRDQSVSEKDGVPQKKRKTLTRAHSLEMQVELSGRRKLAKRDSAQKGPEGVQGKMEQNEEVERKSWRRSMSVEGKVPMIRYRQNTLDGRGEASYILDPIPSKQPSLGNIGSVTALDLSKQIEAKVLQAANFQVGSRKKGLKVWLLNDERSEIIQDFNEAFQSSLAQQEGRKEVLVPELFQDGAPVLESNFARRRLFEIGERLKQPHNPYLTDIRSREFNTVVLFLHYDLFDIMHLQSESQRTAALRALAERVHKFSRLLEKLPQSKEATNPAVTSDYVLLVIGMHPVQMPVEWRIPGDPEGFLWMRYSEDWLHQLLERKWIKLLKIFPFFEHLSEMGEKTEHLVSGLELLPLGRKIISGAIATELLKDNMQITEEVITEAAGPTKPSFSEAVSRSEASAMASISIKASEGGSRPDALVPARVFQSSKSTGKVYYPPVAWEKVNLPPLRDKDGKQVGNPIGYVVRLAHKLQLYFNETDPEKRRKLRLSGKAVQILQMYAPPLGIPINWKHLDQYMAEHQELEGLEELRTELQGSGAVSQVYSASEHSVVKQAAKGATTNVSPSKPTVAAESPSQGSLQEKELKVAPAKVQGKDLERRNCEAASPVVPEKSILTTKPARLGQNQNLEESTAVRKGQEVQTQHKEIQTEQIPEQKLQGVQRIKQLEEQLQITTLQFQQQIAKLESTQQKTADMVNGLVAVVQKQAERLDSVDPIREQLKSHIAESKIQHGMTERGLHNVTKDLGRLEGKVDQNKKEIQRARSAVAPASSSVSQQPISASEGQGRQPSIQVPLLMSVISCIVICTMMSGCSAMVTPNRTYYDCGAGHSGFPLAIPHKISCQMPEEITPFR